MTYIYSFSGFFKSIMDTGIVNDSERSIKAGFITRLHRVNQERHTFIYRKCKAHGIISKSIYGYLTQFDTVKVVLRYKCCQYFNKTRKEISDMSVYRVFRGR